MPQALASLKDARFELTENIEEAQICWLIGPQRNIYKPKAIEKAAFLNEFPCDETLLVKDLFIPLMHSSYKCFKQNSAEESDNALPILESYMVNTQLPAFMGRYYENDNDFLDNSWQVIGG